MPKIKSKTQTKSNKVTYHGIPTKLQIDINFEVLAGFRSGRYLITSPELVEKYKHKYLLIQETTVKECRICVFGIDQSLKTNRWAEWLRVNFQKVV